jgi:2-polyprenyl-3-methyl-5-hydroxy-6-metoxy-1,4-benzoquinol methylase
LSASLPTLEEMKSAWWYYTAELEDGSVAQGIYPDQLPFLPRLMQRQVDLQGCICLDIGPAEGILPILAKKSGAKQVVCAEHSPSIFNRKLQYLTNLHHAELCQEFIGRAQNVGDLIENYDGGFDYINLSGVLYHVTSPLDTIGAARTLLRPSGLMLVSTPIIVARDCFMEFNDRGRLQSEPNTYWYISIGMLDYMLRLLSLKPIDMRYLGDKEDKSQIQPDAWFATVSVLCQATEKAVGAPDDAWMQACSRNGWEIEVYNVRPRIAGCSRAKVRSSSGPLVLAEGTGAVDLYRTILARSAEKPPRSPADARVLRRNDMS